MRPFDARTDLLMLDFDGVITQSIDECLVSGYNAYADYCGNSRIEKLSQLDSGWIESARKMRNFIRNGEDYVYIAHALETGKPVTDQEQFDVFKQEHIELGQIFFDRFYQARSSFAESRPHQWAELSPLYAGMPVFLKQYEYKHNLFIVTTKPLLFVKKILSANSIELRQENLFDTRDGRSKQEIINDILHQRSLQPSCCYFLDDQVDTVIRVKPAGIHTILAEWGYNNREQQKRARDLDIPVFTLEQFFQFFSR